MLDSIEKIEDEILKLLIIHDDDLVDLHDRVEFIMKQGEGMIEEVKKDLDERYNKHMGEKQYEDIYIEEFKEGRDRVMKVITEMLEKESTTTLSKIQVTKSI